MLNLFVKVLTGIWNILRIAVIPVCALLVLFYILCGCHLLYQIIVKKENPKNWAKTN